jgi:hypothetical protein
MKSAFFHTAFKSVGLALLCLSSASLLANNDLEPAKPATKLSLSSASAMAAPIHALRPVAAGTRIANGVTDGERSAAAYASSLGAAEVDAEGHVVAVCVPEAVRARAEGEPDTSCRMRQQ